MHCFKADELQAATRTQQSAASTSVTLSDLSPSQVSFVESVISAKLVTFLGVPAYYKDAGHHVDKIQESTLK